MASFLPRRNPNFIAQPLGRNIDPDGLGGYYCDLRHKARHSLRALPGDGLDREEYWVIPIAQAALGFWDMKIEGADVDRHFLQLADWLLERGAAGSGGVVWRTDFGVPKYGLGPGWISAMGQGQAASVLLRAHRLTDREEYLSTARAALPALLTSVADGGTQSTIDGVPVLEEYPTDRPTAVLNGWIFALFGLYELAIAAEETEARTLFERSADGLVSLLPRYDNGWWSLYSLGDHGRPDLAKPFYQRLHPVLLEALSLIRPARQLDEYGRRWREQLTWLGLTRVSLDKIAFRARRALS